MADEWGLPEINDSWLPDKGACPPVVRSVKAFMEDRIPQAEGQSRNEDQRNINGIFSKLSFNEEPKLKDEEDSDKIKGLAKASVFDRPCTLIGDNPSIQGLLDRVDVEMASEDIRISPEARRF